ncbi:toll-receptor-related 1 isoform X3 [Hydra vulgaris]|uniref:Toll-receptor-related 1 isoform X2 n=1 Tax=Hydra vulgaris TaxID=6087 RepID=A0ABM4C0E9_HYDVU
MLVLVIIIVFQLFEIGDCTLNECVTYLKRENLTQPDIVRRNAEACCPYLRGGFSLLNLTSLGNEYRRFNKKNIEQLYTSTLIPKILHTNSCVILRENDFRTFFCHSTANVSDMDFTTQEGLSFRDFHKNWKNVHSYQLSCGILVLFSPVKLCQHRSFFKCYVKYNETYSHVKTAAIKYVMDPFNLSISRSNDDGKTINITCAYANFKTPSFLNITFSHNGYRLINDSRSFQINPIISLYNSGRDRFSLQRTLSILNPKIFNNTLSCILFDDKCGIVARQNFSYLQDKRNLVKITKVGSTFLLDHIWVALIGFMLLLLLFPKIKSKLHEMYKCSLKRVPGKILENSIAIVNNDKNEKEMYLIPSITNVEQNMTCFEQNINTEQKNNDVFISYSSQNREWVKNTLLFELEKRNIRVCIDFRDFVVGEYISKNILDGMHNSRKTIVVISSDYLKSYYCIEELQTASQGHSVISIMIEKCKLPHYLKQQLSKNQVFKWEDNERFWENLVLAVRS